MGFDLGQAACLVGVQAEPYQNLPSSAHIFAKVVLIDRTEEPMQPFLYRLKNEQMLNEADDPHTHHPNENAFMMIGEFLSIDRANKQICFRAHDVEASNTFTVSYQYLIIAASFKHPSLGASPNEDFAAALQALVEALRVHDYSPRFTKDATPKKGAKTHQNQISSYSESELQILKQIDKTVSSKMQISDHPNQSLAKLRKRLFELQVS